MRAGRPVLRGFARAPETDEVTLPMKCCTVTSGNRRMVQTMASGNRVGSPMSYVRATLLFAAVAPAWGCNGSGSDSAPASRPTPALTRDAVVRFLKAHPVLCAEGARVYERMRSQDLRGSEVVRMKQGLDEAARRFGYRSYGDYEEAAAQVARTAAFLRLAGGHGGMIEPPDGVSSADVEAVRPYLDDLERVEREARVRASGKSQSPVPSDG